MCSSDFTIRVHILSAAVVLLVWLVPGERAQAASARNGKGSLESVYRRWTAATSASDEGVLRIRITSARGLTPPNRARGWLEANLQTGEVSVRIRRLGQPADVWLVDNVPAPGASILPDPGDVIRKLGQLELRGFDSELSMQLDATFFDDFQIDLVVVTSAGASPLDERLLIGAPSGFERRRLGARSSAARRQRQGTAATRDPRVQLGLVSAEVLRGGELFFRDTFGGNGRTCGTCHPVDNNLTIDARFVRALARKNPRDPLFVAEDGHPNQVPELEVPDLLRRFGLILENVDGFEAPTEKFVLRSVPHSLSMATSLEPAPPTDPNAPVDDDTPLSDGSTLSFQQRTGWSGDGAPAPGSLRLFQVGAIIQHYTKDVFDRSPGTAAAPGENFRLPTDEELDDIEAYLLTTGRLRDLDLAAITLEDARAEAGRVLFSQGVGGAKCSICHANAGAMAGAGGNRNLNTGGERARLPEVDERDIPLDGGFGGQNEVAFNFDSDGDGVFDSFGNGTFNTPPLVEAADTPPFFHTNAFDTIEAAVEFYTSDAFSSSPGGELMVRLFGEGIELDEEQIDQVGAFLRVVNAAFNMAIAEQRLAAALAIDEAGEGDRASRRVSDRLVELAAVELLDAREVLARDGLNRSGHRLLRTAIHHSRNAVGERRSARRRRGIEQALELTMQARQRLGTGLEFELGEGNLVF